MIAYIETSALAKLLFHETETDRLARHLDDLTAKDHSIVSSALTETELRRAAVREHVPQSAVTAILDRIDLLDPDRSIFVAAGTLPGPHLRSLDALHIASAVRANADVMLSYDQRQIDAAEEAGVRTLSP